MNPKLYILIGISGSGKSTFAKQMLLSNERLIRVSRDEYRYMWRNTTVVSNKLESVITIRVSQDIEYYLNNGFDVIYDATNLIKRNVSEIVEQFKYYADIEFVVFEVDVETCIQRDAARERKVGESTIRVQYNRFLELKKNFDFDAIPRQKKKYKNQNKMLSKKEAICVDIDGTLADLGDRNPYQYGIMNDKIVVPVRDVLQVFADVRPYCEIIITSGREEKTRKDTETWLKQNKVPYSKLFLRKTGDNRRDASVKKEIYNTEILPYYNVNFVLDDRNQVVAMLRELGLTVFQVAEGNF